MLKRLKIGSSDWSTKIRIETKNIDNKLSGIGVPVTDPLK